MSSSVNWFLSLSRFSSAVHFVILRKVSELFHKSNTPVQYSQTCRAKLAGFHSNPVPSMQWNNLCLLNQQCLDRKHLFLSPLLSHPTSALRQDRSLGLTPCRERCHRGSSSRRWLRLKKHQLPLCCYSEHWHLSPKTTVPKGTAHRLCAENWIKKA